MVDNLEELIDACELAEQLEMENDRPITFKKLLPILEELQNTRMKCSKLVEKLSETALGVELVLPQPVPIYPIEEVYGLGDSPDEDEFETEVSMMTDKTKILQQCGNKISRTELLAALAEECMELAHAALKYRRSLTQDNPTPKCESEAWEDVKEEISDVMNILVSAYFVHPEATIESICSEDKAIRWIERLNGKTFYRNFYKDINTDKRLENIERDYPCCSNCENKKIMDTDDESISTPHVLCKLDKTVVADTYCCKHYKYKTDLDIDYER